MIRTNSSSQVTTPSLFDLHEIYSRYCKYCKSQCNGGMEADHNNVL